MGNLSALALGYSYDQVGGLFCHLGHLGHLGHLVCREVQEGLWGYNAALSCLAVGQLGRNNPHNIQLAIHLGGQHSHTFTLKRFVCPDAFHCLLN